MNARNSFPVLLIGCLLVGSICLTTTNAVAGSKPGKPACGIRRVEMEKIWRAGGDDSEVIFGMVVQIIEGLDGHILVLDFLQSKIFKFGLNGELVREWDVSGEGPGMVNNPINLFSADNGNLGLVQLFPGKIELLTSSFEYLRTVHPKISDSSASAVSYFFDVIPYGQDFLIVGENTVLDKELLLRESFVGIYDPNGNKQISILEQKRVQDWAQFEFNEDEIHQVKYRQVATRNDGIIFVPTSRTGYQITGFNPNGNADIHITRDYPSHKRTAREKEFYAADFAKQATGSVNPKIKVSSVDPDIEMMRVSDNGELWVTNSCSHLSDETCVFSIVDVFDRNGLFIRQDYILIEGEHPSGRLFWLSDEKCVLVTGLKDALDEFIMMSRQVPIFPREMYDLPMEIVFLKVK